MKAYIASSSSISPQNTFDQSEYLKVWQDSKEDYWLASEPPYREFIDPKLSRRMSRVIKMAIATSQVALNNAKVDKPQAIIVGTGLGCITDTIKFLKNINVSEILSPTAFIQSTHNTIAGQIALLQGCPGYNFTYSNRGHSFENALNDAIIQLDDGLENVLVGSADEITTDSFEILQKIGCAGKLNDENEIHFGEGASFFVLTPENTSGIGIQDIKTRVKLDISDFDQEFNDFLNKNSLKVDDIDLILSGKNTSDNDGYYDRLEELTTDRVETLEFKPISGEFMTASSFGVHLGFMILNNRELIDQSVLKIKNKKPIKNLLIYNNYQGGNHSFILLASQ